MGKWKGNHSVCTLLLHYFPKHLPLSAVKGRILGWMDLSSDPGWQFPCVWGVEWGVAVNLHLLGSEDPKHDFPLLPKPLWL